MNAIIVSDLTKRFGDFVAVDHLTFDARRVSFGFLGSNGAGKSPRFACLRVAEADERNRDRGRHRRGPRSEGVKSRIGMSAVLIMSA